MTEGYKLVTLRSPRWADYDAATLLISVGQPYHEGEKFAVTVDWAARHFERLHVLVADTLQRHNEPGDWQAAGAAWVARNRDCWLSCGREVAVSHWDDWLRAPEFPAVLHGFRAAECERNSNCCPQAASRYRIVNETSPISHRFPQRSEVAGYKYALSLTAHKIASGSRCRRALAPSHELEWRGPA